MNSQKTPQPVFLS